MKKLLIRAVALTAIVAGTVYAEGCREWELHSSRQVGMRFRIPPSATWHSETWDDANGRGWAVAHAFNEDRRPRERCDLFVIAREDADLSNPNAIRAFVAAFTEIPGRNAWRDITPDDVTGHRRWVGTRARDNMRFHVFLGATSGGGVLIVLRHPVGHAVDNEENYRYWYDSIELLQD
jgi:hypothetical protein